MAGFSREVEISVRAQWPSAGSQCKDRTREIRWAGEAARAPSTSFASAFLPLPFLFLGTPRFLHGGSVPLFALFALTAIHPRPLSLEMLSAQLLGEEEETQEARRREKREGPGRRVRNRGPKWGGAGGGPAASGAQAGPRRPPARQDRVVSSDPQLPWLEEAEQRLRLRRTHTGDASGPNPQEETGI